MRNVILRINNLPARSGQLSVEQMVNVFGGCRQLGERCSKSEECCDSCSCEASFDRGRGGVCKQKLNGPFIA